MTDRDAMLNAWLAGEMPPEVFADWLEEQGFGDAAMVCRCAAKLKTFQYIITHQRERFVRECFVATTSWRSAVHD